MPFTFSHPAIVLPLTKVRSAYVSMSCMVVGSMTPDFQYFLQMKLKGRIMHTWHGAFLVGLPVAIFLVFIFHLIVKRPLINNLPAYFQSRLHDLYDVDFMKEFKGNFIPYLVCLQIGVLSHVFWDGFTHANTYFVQHIEFLSWRVDYGVLPKAPLFRYVQHISTLVGAVAIAWYFHHLPQRRNHVIPASLGYWLVLFVSMAIAFTIRWWFGFRVFGDGIVSLISSLFIGLIVAGLAFHSSGKRFTA
jgi:hypothetical protein